MPRPRTVEIREVERLAAVGVELADILDSLDVPEAARKDKAVMAKVLHAVKVGHARHRAAIARRLEREGVKRGKAHSLLSLARNRLDFDSKQTPDLLHEHAQRTDHAVDEIGRMLDRIHAARCLDDPEAAYRGYCPCCRAALLCECKGKKKPPEAAPVEVVS